MALKEALERGTYKVKGKKICVDDACLYVGDTVKMVIHGVSAEVYFPDILKLPSQKLKLLQLG
jgi:hypothetical protein